MKKWIITGCVAVLVIIALLIFGLSNLGPIIKKAVNSYGPQITKTELKLDDVDISIFSAAAKLKGFVLGNPQGFSSAQAMSVKSIKVNVDEKTLTKDTIVIDNIEVIAPDISYEKISGTDNFRAILNNVKKSTASGQKTKKETPEKEKEGAGKKLLIKNFIVKDGKIHFTSSVLGKRTIEADLPDIHLKNIGQQKGGATPSEAAQEIFKALYAKITSPAVTDILNKSLKDLTGDPNAVLDKLKKQSGVSGDAVKEATDKLKGLLKK